MTSLKRTLLKISLMAAGIAALLTSGVIVMDFASRDSTGFPGFRSRSGEDPGSPKPESTRSFSGMTHSAGDESDKEIARLRNEQVNLLRKLEALECRFEGMENESENQEHPYDSVDYNDLEIFDDIYDAEDERITAEYEAQVDLLDYTIEAEPSDPRWSAEASRAIRVNALRQASIQIQRLNVQCRSSLCRIEMTFLPGGTGEEFKNLETLVPWNGEMFFRIDASGEALVFVAREDHTLPRMAR